MAPPDARFGWPKRNGFVQPMVDAELYGGLDRFDHVEVRWGHRMENCVETDDGVTVEFADGQEPVHARYVVGCDGGPQRHPPIDGCVVRRHHVVDPLAGGRRRE